MKSKLKKRVLILIVLGIFFAISSIYYSNPCLKATSKDKSADYSDHFTLDRENLKISALSRKIHIDNNWTATKAAGICTGEGTYSNPYVIEDLVIDGGGVENCIWIENSLVYFKIKNCKIFNAFGQGSNGGGIYFINVSNGYIVDNQVNNNEYVGINLGLCNNITISKNDISNQKVGIALFSCYNITIQGNTLNYNDADSSLFLYYSDYNTIYENSLNYNHLGIQLWFSWDNNISRNFINFNDNGIWIYEGCRRNIIYLNCLNNNSLTAFDEGGWNHWDNGTVGNYWSDYTGVDNDENGIGDTPYNITKSMYNSAVTNQDNFPLMECPLPVPVQDDNGDVIPLELIIIISVISGGVMIGVATVLLLIRKRKRIE